MTDRVWTLAERRVQLAELIGHALWIKKTYDTDAYDDIVAQCQRFVDHGFTDGDLKAFSRDVGTPPGWLHHRSDGRVQMEMEQPRLAERLDRIEQLLLDLRTLGYRTRD